MVDTDTDEGPGKNESESNHHLSDQEFVEPWTLEQLVSMQEKIILYEDQNYLSISKPADLRMDGPKHVTLQKVLLSWFPTNSMLKIPECKRREFILTLSKWSDLKDNELRHCHQLDYATSGVLLFAKSKEAAAAACNSFQDRLAQKTYVAIVHGHFNTSVFPCLAGDDENNPLMDWEDGGLEDMYRKGRRHKFRGKNSFKGFLPTHTIFENWKSQTRSKLKKKIKACDGDQNIDEIIDIDPIERDRLMKMKWSEIKCFPNFRNMFESLAKNQNSRKKEELEAKTREEGRCRIHQRKRQNPDKNLPHVFRLKLEASDTSSGKNEENDRNEIFIHCNIATVKNQFRMMFDLKSISSKYHGERNAYYRAFDNNIDISNLDYKPSLTRCIVLWRGYLKGKPVSKILLHPKTGRRHQLRVHTLITGHPIVGDVTYEHPSQSKESICDRMCLHAYNLSIPLLNGKMNFTAPDPFLVSSTEVVVGDGPRWNADGG